MVSDNGGSRVAWEKLMSEAAKVHGSTPIKKITGSAHTSTQKKMNARIQLHRDKVQGIRSPDSLYLDAGLPVPERKKTFWDKRRGGS